MRKYAAYISFFFISALLFTACSSTIPKSEVEFADAVLENILNAIQNKDYQVFQKYLSDDMKKTLTQEAFNNLTSTIEQKIGKYQSKTYAQAKRVSQGEKKYISVVYKAKYSDEPKDVLITISFSDDQNHLVEGLFFNSPNLNK